ncbi:neural/ectodermal development factor IMP-L2 isoform X2 [Euwallacea similis]|uniref:neural/ectodermal development factor IMP-L2 isoform X1 n=1 Tax=Euwallacea similis TaxID=1736056 RepID=UPI00344BA5E2
MVKLSVLLTTLCLQLVYSRHLSNENEVDNDVSAFPEESIGSYNEYKPQDFVKINQPPEPVVQRNVGKHVELHCEAMGSPPPTIQWFKGSMRITENESFEDNNFIVERTAPGLAKVSSRLVINYVLPRHQDTYYCVAEAGSKKDRRMTKLVVPNGQGREMNLTELIARKIVGAHHHPRVTFWAPAYMDVMGSDVILPCKSVGNPKPDLVWYDPSNKQIDTEDNTRFSIRPDGELSIRSISWEDMGVYTCIVKNSVGEDSVESFLYPMQESK